MLNADDSSDDQALILVKPNIVDLHDIVDTLASPLCLSSNSDAMTLLFIMLDLNDIEDEEEHLTSMSINLTATLIVKPTYHDLANIDDDINTGSGRAHMLGIQIPELQPLVHFPENSADNQVVE